MSLRRAGIALLVGSLAATVATVPVSMASAERAKSERGVAAKRFDQKKPPHGNATGKLPAPHSLRAPVTDENFYFVMADRFENGASTNDTGGIPGTRLEHGFDPTSRGFYNGGDLKDCWIESTTSAVSAPPLSG
jgi:alpha-amylase